MFRNIPAPERRKKENETEEENKHREQTPGEHQCRRLYSQTLTVHSCTPLPNPARTVRTTQLCLPFAGKAIKDQREEATFPSHPSLTKTIKKGP